MGRFPPVPLPTVTPAGSVVMPSIIFSPRLLTERFRVLRSTPQLGAWFCRLALVLVVASGCRSPYYADRGAGVGALAGAGAGAIIGDATGGNAVKASKS